MPDDAAVLPRQSRNWLPSRRAFLIGAGATAGLAIGWALWPRDRALNLAAGEGETILSAWLKIGADGQVTVVVPQAEMGQGVFTSLPQILADELGADWRMVGVEPAPIHPEYYNRAFAEMGAAAAPGPLKGIARWAASEALQRMALQMTGGSTSVVAYTQPLRVAGAAARELLCRAAARGWDVDWRDCDTSNGFVVHKANRVAFKDVIGRIDPDVLSDVPALRDDSKLRFIGRSMPRLDVPAKVDGSARFGVDVRVPGLLYASVRAGPVDGAPLQSVDLAPAQSMPGVVRVVKGQTWVAAVANSWWAADNAVQQLAPVFAASDRADSGRIDAALAAALKGEAKAFREDGDIEGARAGGAPVVVDYSVPYLAHACLEPMTATVRIGDAGVEVWAPTQSATLVRYAVSRALDLDGDRVTVYPTLLGGGFGRKAEVDACVQAALIAREAKAPVQLIFARSEDMGQDKFRPAARARMTGRIGADKRIALWDAVIAVPPIMPSMMKRIMPSMAGEVGPDVSALEGATELPYAAGAIRVAHAPADLPVPIGYWRSVGHSYTAFFNECFVDELAQAAGIDPLTFRLRMLDAHPRHADVLKLAASRGGYVPGGSDGVARGLAVHESFGSIVAHCVEVDMSGENGLRVRKVTSAIDCGRVINPDIVRQQIEGSVIFALTAALDGRITFKDGMAEQMNFDSYPLLPLRETPEIAVHIVPSRAASGGVGEPGVPPLAPALANAVFAATGERIRSLPLRDKLNR